MLLPLIQGKNTLEPGSWEGDYPTELPVLPLRNVVAFPYTLLPLAAGLPRSIHLLEDVLEGDRLLALVAMTDPSVEQPGPDGVYPIGTLAQIERAMRVDDNYQIVVRGIARIRVVEWVKEEPYLCARIELLPEQPADETETEALRRELLADARKLVSFLPQVPEGIVDMLAQIADPSLLVYMVASNVRLEIPQAQEILAGETVAVQMRTLLTALQRELEVMELGQQIRQEAQSEIEKTQREYYLRQQLKAIQKELGEDGEESEVETYRAKIEEASLPEEARNEALRELDRLAQMNPQSAEAGVIKTYLDWLTDLPWNVLSEDNLDLEHAQRILDEDHYGLEKVKERIIEFLAVRKLRLERGVEDDATNEGAPAILAFVGPPGVGKTSLGRSIARALGREFTRMSLGGVRDEAEIRGHRRTYIGAMPGRIIQALKRVGTRNPVFMLDEVDKIGADWRGDPSSALLEVLDPQQNFAFRDHYLDVDFDLSQVFFICTANTLSTIPPALRDRMEVIEIDGYTEYDKVQIAQGYLLPRQIKTNGLRPEEVEFSAEAIQTIIRDYTREAGVRNLEREIGRALRKVAMQIARRSQDRVETEAGEVTAELAVETEEEAPTWVTVVDVEQVREFLGKPRFRDEARLRTELPGVATGLAWTPTGGEVLFVEARIMPGKDGLILTGQLGDVMKESARIALSYVQGELESLALPTDVLEGKTIHLHVPAGAIPKDGPSAGVTMVTALVSALTGQPVLNDVGMTGEVTLQGQLLPIGGVKQKVLAAHRYGLKTVILPRANEVDLDDVPAEIQEEMHFLLAEHVREVLEAALKPLPLPEPESEPEPDGSGETTCDIVPQVAGNALEESALGNNGRSV
ncbi:MAG TPA: endopeptidase La [Chloroflexi bacterium]|nr:endopeptidase La [Chloroflexota bacterium]